MGINRKESKIGGRREGAGRKTTAHKEGRTMIVGVTVPIRLVKKLDVWRKSKKLNRSESVTEAIRRLVRRS